MEDSFVAFLGASGVAVGLAVGLGMFGIRR
jgi:hypothetical protein